MIIRLKLSTKFSADIQQVMRHFRSKNKKVRNKTRSAILDIAQNSAEDEKDAKRLLRSLEREEDRRHQADAEKSIRSRDYQRRGHHPATQDGLHTLKSRTQAQESRITDRQVHLLACNRHLGVVKWYTKPTSLIRR
jgi:hypothetical protein